MSFVPSVATETPHLFKEIQERNKKYQNEFESASKERNRFIQYFRTLLQPKVFDSLVSPYLEYYNKLSIESKDQLDRIWKHETASNEGVQNYSIRVLL